MAERDHIRGLTGLRGVAAVWVLLVHLWQFSGGARHPLSLAGWTFDPTWFVSCGYFGVDLFFVLSGFLLSLPWHRAAEEGTPTPSLIRFWYHRARRVLPAYWLQMMLLIATYALLGQFDRIQPTNIASHLGLVQNLFGSGKLLNPVYWSMPIEWDFYVALPLLAFLMIRAPAWLIAVFALTFSLTCRLLAYLGWFDPAIAQYINYSDIHQLPARLDQFVYGMLAAWILVRRPAWAKQSLLWLAAGLIGILAMVLSAGPREDFLGRFDAPWLFFHHSLLAAAFAMLILGVASGAPLGKRLFAGPLVVWLGLISYSLYLWHYPLLQVWQFLAGAGWFGGWPILALFGVATPVIVVISWLSYRYVELPFLTMKK